MSARLRLVRLLLTQREAEDVQTGLWLLSEHYGQHTDSAAYRQAVDDLMTALDGRAIR